MPSDKAMKKLPQKIWLQVGDDENVFDDIDFHEVTWCRDKINNTDVEYVRGEALADAMRVIEWKPMSLFPSKPDVCKDGCHDGCVCSFCQTKYVLGWDEEDEIYVIIHVGAYHRSFKRDNKQQEMLNDEFMRIVRWANLIPPPDKIAKLKGGQ